MTLIRESKKFVCFLNLTGVFIEDTENDFKVKVNQTPERITQLTDTEFYNYSFNSIYSQP